MKPRRSVGFGAGLAGLGFAHHLQEQHKQRRFAILEARERLGGTWDLFRYPGVRSDVDLHLHGYAHRPWTGRIGVASADDILAYLDEMAEDEGLKAQVRTGHRVVSADCRSDEDRWIVTCERPGGKRVRLSCGWLQMCADSTPMRAGTRQTSWNRSASAGRSFIRRRGRTVSI